MDFQRFHSEQASPGSPSRVLMFEVTSRRWLYKKKKAIHECCQHCFRGCRSRRSACQCADCLLHINTVHKILTHLGAQCSLRGHSLVRCSVCVCVRYMDGRRFAMQNILDQFLSRVFEAVQKEYDNVCKYLCTHEQTHEIMISSQLCGS